MTGNREIIGPLNQDPNNLGQESVLEKRLLQLKRQRLVLNWLSGSIPPTIDELAAMPRFIGEDAETSRQKWLHLNRKRQVITFFSGEGEIAADGVDYFVGDDTELHRRILKSLRRNSAFLSWLRGAYPMTFQKRINESEEGLE